MPASNTPTRPELPFPIFQISREVGRYLLYDIMTITWLRQTHNILGVLIGTLPQIPQQNVFLGLPLELQPEEARLLVQKGLAYTVDDLHWHTADLESKSAAQIEAIKAHLHEHGLDVARELQESKIKRTHEALRRLRSNSGSSVSTVSKASPDPQVQDDASVETLFGDLAAQDSLPAQPRAASKASNSKPKPWTLTPTTSYPPLALPSKSTSPSLPNVKASSYALFKHLHSRGYFMTPGIRFGCQFSVYPGDPLRFHSHFLAMSADWDEEIDLLDLVGGGRLSTGVKKGWLVGGVEEKEKNGADMGQATSAAGGEVDDSATFRTFCVEWGGM